MVHVSELGGIELEQRESLEVNESEKVGILPPPHWPHRACVRAFARACLRMASGLDANASLLRACVRVLGGCLGKAVGTCRYASLHFVTPVPRAPACPRERDSFAWGSMGVEGSICVLMGENT